MYDELVKRLRCQRFGNCPNCPMWYTEEVEPNLWRERCAAVDAADAIEELLQKMQQLPQWIPVTERLPKADEYDVRGYAVPYLVMNGWMRVTARRTKDYWVLFGEGKVLEYVTHWMPLPQPPEEET